MTDRTRQRLRNALREKTFHYLIINDPAITGDKLTSLMSRVLEGSHAYVVPWLYATRALNAIPLQRCWQLQCIAFCT